MLFKPSTVCMYAMTLPPLRLPITQIDRKTSVFFLKIFYVKHFFLYLTYSAIIFIIIWFFFFWFVFKTFYLFLFDSKFVREHVKVTKTISIRVHGEGMFSRYTWTLVYNSYRTSRQTEHITRSGETDAAHEYESSGDGVGWSWADGVIFFLQVAHMTFHQV